MLVVQDAGLCIGWSHFGKNEQEGLIVFTRVVMIKKIWIYDSNVLLPFIDSIRKEYSSFYVSDSISIPDELTAAAWRMETYLKCIFHQTEVVHQNESNSKKDRPTD